MGAVSHCADNHEDPDGRDDATIQPGGDADRTMPSGPEGDRTMPSGPASDARAASPVRADRIPDRIGDCRVEKRLGTGGFGDVLLAVQETDLLKRRVAIKLLKRGMDSEAVLERFRVERKVLDTLNHPNIARLLGGGETEDGRSYLVMEFVDGLTIDLWCERQSLDAPARLRLLKQVASALAHAHERGIVHRDLKPANVLVGADGVPKLLDFGIAKIITPGVTETERGHLTLPGETGPLTTAYASPEQLRGEPLAASTDIYSFGVMMYEVLSGQLPFDFTRSSFDEIRRRVCSQTPPPPSAAGGSRTTTDPVTTSGSMRRSLRGDVDNIVMMAIRKEPTRRYASMGALIADIDAHLEDRPIVARPSSLAYRLSKSITRNRWRVALAAALVLTAATGATWWGLSRLRVERQYQQALAPAKETRKDEDFFVDASKAQTDLEQGRKVAEARVRSRPGDVAARRDLLLVLLQTCELQENARDTTAGLATSQRALELARELRAKPGTHDDRNALCKALQKRGDLLMVAKDLGAARRVYDELLKERRALSDEKPDDIGLLQSMSVALQRMRESAIGEADLEGAVRADRELKEVRGRVMRSVQAPAKDPASPGASTETAEAKARREKQQKESDKAERQWMLACMFLAGDLLALDQLQQAESEALTARDIGQARLERDRKDWRRHDDLAHLQEVLYMIAYQRADLAAAQAEVDRYAARARAAVEASSATGVALASFVLSGNEQARVRNDLGRHAEALEGLADLVETAERYRSGAGAQAKGEAISREAALNSMSQRCRALRGLGRLAEARALVPEIQARIALPNAGVQWHAARSDAAREASRCVEDPATAIRLAQASVESSKQCGDRLIEAQAHLALHDALKAAGRPEAAEALAAAKSAAASSDTPRAKAMLAAMQPPAPKAPVAAPAAPATPTAPPSASASAPAPGAPAGAGKTP